MCLCGKYSRGSSGLEEERCPLRAWVDDERTFQLVVLPFMLDRSDLGRIDISLGYLILYYSIIGDRRLPESADISMLTGNTDCFQYLLI